jgi:LPXTG-motif cell wall-anchored protein
MKRTLLTLLGILLLSVAGSVIAQSEYGSSDQAPANQPATTSTPDSSNPTSGSTSDLSSSPAATDQNSTADPAGSKDMQHRKSLPATASSDPFALALGLSALGSAIGVHLYRRRSAH